MVCVIERCNLSSLLLVVVVRMHECGNIPEKREGERGRQKGKGQQPAKLIQGDQTNFVQNSLVELKAIEIQIWATDLLYF